MALDTLATARPVPPIEADHSTERQAEAKGKVMTQPRNLLKVKKTMETPTEDKTIKCTEHNCDNEFTLTIGEQRFYIDKGLYLPKRCADCREKRRKEKEDRIDESQ